MTDGSAWLRALAVENGERGIMDRAPFHPPGEHFQPRIGWQILWIGTLMGLVSLLTGSFIMKPASLPKADTWQTMSHFTLTLAQMGNALATAPMSIGLQHWLYQPYDDCCRCHDVPLQC
ncbi:MAG: cation transporting ATPase C-terminal domain-containing protein [Ardenticatenaceae bacterium]|nr:cation transporting ATPase C-terminal domain-containing protein [Ardenticatenaceae bacterium]